MLRQRLCLCSIGMVFLIAIPAFGQVRAQDNISESVQVSGRKKDDRFDINFRGGTLQEFVDKLRASDKNVNVLVSEQASDVLLPAIELKNVTIEHALNTVELLHSRQANAIILDYVEDPNNNTVSIVVDLQMPDSNPRIKRTVINASAALGWFEDEKPDQKLMETIENGLQAVFDDQSRGTITVNIHPETGLLFLQGREDKVEFVKNIISELEKNNTDMSGILGGMLGGEGIGGPLQITQPPNEGDEKKRK